MNDFFHSRLDVFTIFLDSVYVEGMYVFCAEKYSINLFGNCNPKKSRKWLQNKAVVHCTLKKFAATR